MKERLRNAAAIGLAVAGVWNSALFFTGLRWPPAIDPMFLVSPVALVFNNKGSLETFTRRFEVRVHSESGVRFLPGTREFMRRVRGPFSRQKIYFELLSYWDTWTGSGAVLMQSFCGDGHLARELGVREFVTGVTFTITHDPPQPDWDRTLKMTCQ